MFSRPSLRAHDDLFGERIDDWKEMKKCRRCGLPINFRDLRFDEDGVCNHCTHYLELRSAVDDGRREGELIELIERYRGGGADYDAILCYSGGKDSSYLLDRCLNEYGLEVLAVTVRTGFQSEIAAENISRGIERLGVDHLWLDADPELVGALRYGFQARTRKGLECDVCDLCDGHMRRRIIEVALEKQVPLILHGADHFQLVDSGLDSGSSLLFYRDACLPSLARQRDMFRELYEIPDLDRCDRPPLELYPFLYLPYNEVEICRVVEERGLVVSSDPDATNCDFVFLINILEFLRNGYPAYVHNTSAAILQGELDLATASAELLDWVGEYREGRYDDQVFSALPRLGLSLEQLIDSPRYPSDCRAESARGTPVRD